MKIEFDENGKLKKGQKKVRIKVRKTRKDAGKKRGQRKSTILKQEITSLEKQIIEKEEIIKTEEILIERLKKIEEGEEIPEDIKLLSVLIPIDVESHENICSEMETEIEELQDRISQLEIELNGGSHPKKYTFIHELAPNEPVVFIAYSKEEALKQFAAWYSREFNTPWKQSYEIGTDYNIKAEYTNAFF